MSQKIFNTIAHAIIPAAGLGTRFLPITKSIPKEMLPLLNLPAAHYIAREAVDAGITSLSFIINKNKQALINYFSSHDALKKAVAGKKDAHLLDDLESLLSRAHYAFIPQPEPRGLGNAIYMAHKVVNDDCFAVMLPDDILTHETQQSALKDLINAAQQHQAAIIAVEKVSAERISSYGIIKVKQELDGKSFEIEHVIEKPKPDDAPSSYGIIGRYIFPKTIFTILEKTAPSSGGEIQLTDAINTLIQSGQKVIAHVTDHHRFDLGSPPGWLAANNYFAKN